MRRELLLLLLAPAALVAQQAGAPDLAARRARLQRELDPATFAAVTRVVDGASRRGIPEEPLVNKALEGVVMRRPADRIRVGVEKLAERMELARQALAPASARDVEAGAEALGVGVPAATLKELRAIRPRESVSVELGVLAQLVASGVPVARASARITELMRNGARPQQILALGSQVGADVEQGMQPEGALDTRARGIFAGNFTGAAAADARNAEGALTPPTAGNSRPPSTTPPRSRAPRRP